jgi:hypothetical protein
MVRFQQANDVGIASQDHLGQGIGTPFAAIKDVVADDSHALAVTDRLFGRSYQRLADASVSNSWTPRR